MHIVGICGGLQMLGTRIADPHGVEGQPGDTEAGLGWLDVATSFAQQKQTSQACLTVGLHRIEGYEIHAGRTTRGRSVLPFGRITTRSGQEVDVEDGATTADGTIWGTYLHGLFADDGFRRQWLTWLSWQDNGSVQPTADAEYDRLADALEEAIGWPAIERFLFASAEAVDSE